MGRYVAYGSSQYLRHTDAGIITSGPMSFSCWFNADDVTARHFLVSTYYLGGNYDRYALQLRGDAGGDPVVFQVYQGSPGQQNYAVTSSGYSASTWQHAGGAANSSGHASVWLNGGSKVTDNTFTTIPANIDQARITAFPGGFYSTVQVAEVGMWSAELTDAEILMLAAGYSPLLVRPQSLVAYWPLIGRTSPEIDIVGGYDMTLINGPTTVPHPRVIYPWSVTYTDYRTTTKRVKQSGGDYPTLNAALLAADPSDIISIEGAWTGDDTTAATIADDNLTIQTDVDSKHPGYWDESQNHYRLVVSGNHALTLSGAYTLTLDGMAIEQSGTVVSDEGFRCVPGTADTVTAKNCLIRCSTNSAQQDSFYTGYNVNIGTINLENCMIWGAGRGGVNIQNFTGAFVATGIVNVNSCILWNNGRFGSPVNATRVGGGIASTNSDASADGSGFTINVHNTISVENDTGGTGGGVAPKDYHNNNLIGVPVGAFNVSYSIDSDGSIATETDGGTGNLASREATDNIAPGGGDWVIFEDITSSPYDLRIVDNAEDDAQDMHSTEVAHGLTIPGTDIVGTARPQNTNYDCGAFEIADVIDVSTLLSLMKWRRTFPIRESRL